MKHLPLAHQKKSFTYTQPPDCAFCAFSTNGLTSCFSDSLTNECVGYIDTRA